ncbi:MAG: hypothetical protein M0R06_08975 [Sphaerochaeta sp.]|jgi:hypothetical protein|nr:hypothetical protein [Sphaerochaeta sp.]
MTLIDATTFADPEMAVATVIDAAMPDVYASNVTPAPIPAKTVIVGYSGGGGRDWGEASVNLGVNCYALTDAGEDGVRALVRDVQTVLAVTANDQIERISVPVGSIAIPRQTPPFQRYFPITVWLRGLDVIDEEDILDLS